jgi:hypothetical protein
LLEVLVELGAESLESCRGFLVQSFHGCLGEPGDLLLGLVGQPLPRSLQVVGQSRQAFVGLLLKLLGK